MERVEYEYCLRCGRKLKSSENRLRGMGKVCWEKSQQTLIQKPLFDPKNNSGKSQNNA